ncbi:copper ion chaperone [Rhodocollybia butyracea]|uniref:Copper ion chaperone n=1 Tax=Rhodocollybia butyracea TaxID=206335 RepID=A0A9P5UDK0_9AGAR|nr:copper ion chaperone [Rhodocollybia butyracea]
MAEHTYKFDVKMTCSGCSGAVTRVLDKAQKSGEVNEFTVTLDTQEVIVKTPKPYDEILEKIKKTGKEVCISSNHR